MDTVDQLQKQRRLLVQQMLEITCTRKGTINRQCVRARKNGKPTERLLGPYWVLTAKKGKIVSLPLASEQAVAHAYEEIANHKRFLDLFHQFEELTQRLGTLLWEASASEKALKKGLKSK